MMSVVCVCVEWGLGVVDTVTQKISHESGFYMAVSAICMQSLCFLEGFKMKSFQREDGKTE